MAVGGESLQQAENCDTLEAEPSEFVMVPRKDLERWQMIMLGAVHQMRDHLGHAPVMTLKQARKRGLSDGRSIDNGKDPG